MEKYMVIESDSRKELEELVIETIEAGYVPCGGVSVSSEVYGEDCANSETIFSYFQAVMLPYE